MSSDHKNETHIYTRTQYYFEGTPMVVLSSAMCCSMPDSMTGRERAPSSFNWSYAKTNCTAFSATFDTSSLSPPSASIETQLQRGHFYLVYLEGGRRPGQCVERSPNPPLSPPDSEESVRVPPWIGKTPRIYNVTSLAIRRLAASRSRRAGNWRESRMTKNHSGRVSVGESLLFHSNWLRSTLFVLHKSIS